MADFSCVPYFFFYKFIARKKSAMPFTSHPLPVYFNLTRNRIFDKFENDNACQPGISSIEHFAFKIYGKT